MLQGYFSHFFLPGIPPPSVPQPIAPPGVTAWFALIICSLPPTPGPQLLPRHNPQCRLCQLSPISFLNKA